MSMKLISFGILIALAVPAIAAEPTDLGKTPTLYVVGYAHLDTQWRWTYPEVINRMIPATMHENFRLIEKYPDYVFNFSGANRYRLMKEYYPADFSQVKAYVAAGRWFPCGSSMEECDVNVPSPESIIRQVLYGNHFFRNELGKVSSEFMLPDCFGFPASLPSVLAHCGIKGFSTQKLTWGSAVGIPFNVGVWEGPDGRSVVAALNPGSYVGSVREDLSVSRSWLDRVNENGSKSGVFADYHYYGTGDQGGAPGEDSVKRVAESVKGTGPLKVISATAEQMFVDIKPDQAAKLPRYKGDLLLTQHSAASITSEAYMKRFNRENELLADAAEKASVAAEWLGGMDYPRKKLNDAWTLVMGGEFHDILPGTSLPKAYEYSWNDELLAMNQFTDVMEQGVRAIASALDTRAKGMPVVVYNPLGVARQDVVEADMPAGSARTVRVVGPDGKEVPSQVIGTGKPRVLFVVKAPAAGFAVYDVQAAKSEAASSALKVTATSLENARYRVKIDANGDVCSIFDKSLGRELLAGPMRLAFQYENPREYPAWNMDWEDQSKPPRGYVDGKPTVRIVENGPVRVALGVEREKDGSKFSQVIRLSAGSAGDRVEFFNTIDWRGKECCLKAVFPLTASNPMATYSWEVGTVQRGNNDPKKYEVPSHQWFDLTDKSGDYGATVLSDCKYGSDKPDDSTLRLTLLHTPGTRGGFGDQATQDWGRHEILFGLAGHQSDWRAAGTDWQALRMQQPLIAFSTSGHSGKLGRTFSLVKIDNPRIRLMAVKKAEDSNEIVLRMVEMDGKSAKNVHIEFASGIASARELNGQEQPVGAAKVENGALIADFGPYSLHTFGIKLKPSAARLRQPECTPVTLPYDVRLASRDGESSETGFDSNNRRLPAEMLPKEINDCGVTFALAPADQPNGMTCKGQSIGLPKTKFNRIAILAAASPVDQKADFVLDGRKVTLNIQDWGGFIGQWDTRTWKPGTDECTGVVPGYTKPAPVAWFCSHRHNAQGQNEAYSYAYLFRYAIEAPKGALQLTLPNNDKIKVMAVTVIDDPMPRLETGKENGLW